MWIQTKPKKRVADIDTPIFEEMYNRYGSLIAWLYPVHDGAKYIPSDVDLSYHFHSDDKILYRRFADRLDDFGLVIDYIYNMYNQKWNHLWKTLNLDYDPLSTEQGTKSVETQGDKSGNKTDAAQSSENNNKQNESKVSKDVNQSQYVEDAEHNSQSEQIFGFNSLDGVAANTSGDASNTANKNTTYGNSSDKTFGNERSDTNTTHNSSGTFDERYVDSVIEKYAGRVGMKPTDLLQSEIDFRKCIFLDIVFGDVDKLITIGVY